MKFALGDDEIDYSLYNPDHPSGSAYYDLEILQSTSYGGCYQAPFINQVWSLEYSPY